MNRRQLKAETIEKLLDAAFAEFQHDTGPQDKEWVSQRSMLRGRFVAILDKPFRLAVSASDGAK